MAAAEGEHKGSEHEGGGHRMEAVPCAKRVRVAFGGEVVADTARALLVLETGHTPVYYFPAGDVRADLLRRTAHRTH